MIFKPFGGTQPQKKYFQVGIIIVFLYIKYNLIEKNWEEVAYQVQFRSNYSVCLTVSLEYSSFFKPLSPGKGLNTKFFFYILW